MNTVNDNSSNKELEEMRLELQSLREILQSQKIFSDRAIRKAMGERSRWISKFVNAEIYFVLPLISLLFLAIKIFIGLSWPFVIVTWLICCIDVVLDRIINRLSTNDFATLSMVRLKERLNRQKAMRSRQLIIEVPIIIVWAGWFVYDMVDNAVGIFKGIPSWTWFVLVAVSLVAGMVVVMVIYGKMQATDSAIIAELDELEKENLID